MCGRFAMFDSDAALERDYDAPLPFRTAPRYNIAPSQPLLAVRRSAAGGNEFTHLTWGLVPSWSKDPAMGARLINARAETVAEKPAFRSPFRYRRCLVPASGFFEWKGEGRGKQPWFVRPKGGRGTFGLGAIWESWLGADGSGIESCAILTTAANGLMAPIHDRMPVIVPPRLYAAWLGADVHSASEIGEILSPYPEGSMEAYPVSRLVNSPAVDREECVAPVAGGSLPF